MNYKKVIMSALVAGAFLANTTLASASGSSYGTSNCQVIYGGGEVCHEQVKFTIDKKVMQPTKGGGYVDNLSSNDARFQPGSDAAFQITITNTGNKTIEKLTVVDTLPSNLLFVSGVGNYNSSDKTITYTISNLEAGKSNQQTFVAKIADKSKFSQTVTCVTNAVKAYDNNGNNANDNASLCIENVVVAQPEPKVFTSYPPKTIPNTGPEMLPLLGLIPAGISGYFLRKKSKLG